MKIIDITIAILLFTLLITSPLSSISVKYFKDYNKNCNNIWTDKDEGAHYPCNCEWWGYYVSLDLENNERWDAYVQYQYNAREHNGVYSIGMGVLVCFFLNRETGKHYEFSLYDNENTNFTFKKNILDIKYKNTSFRGLYPNYHAFVKENSEGFGLNLSLKAETDPHWAIDEAANGYFPWWGSGIAKYGFIPKLSVNGTITIKGENTKALGVGYYEHVWGNLSYLINYNKDQSLKDFKENIQVYYDLAKWYLFQQDFSPTINIKRTKDNLLGYDWTWAVFDNGWSLWSNIFHFLHGIKQGPATGILTVTPDGKEYWEFADLNIKYLRSIYVEESDTYFPLDIEITGRKENILIYLKIISTTEPHVDLGLFPCSRHSCGLGVIQTGGVVTGYCKIGDEKISLNGICSFGPWRKFSSLTKHNKVASLLNTFKSLFQGADTSNLDLSQFKKEPLHKLYVGGIGSDNHSTIQEAIDISSKGDSIFVYNGTYKENIVINKSIKLIGENKEQTILISGDDDGIKITSDKVELSGFTINAKGLDYWTKSAIDISSCDNYIHGNKIISSNWYGIFLNNCSKNIIYKNIIQDNDIGIWLYKSNENKIFSNHFESNSCVALWLWHSSKDNIISSNNFVDNRMDGLNQDEMMLNKWIYNYWDDLKQVNKKFLLDKNNVEVSNLPYKIFNFRFDMHPALRPYDID